MCAATSLCSMQGQGGRARALTEGKHSKSLPQMAGPDLRKECLSRAAERSPSTMRISAYELLANPLGHSVSAITAKHCI